MGLHNKSGQQNYIVLIGCYLTFRSFSTLFQWVLGGVLGIPGGVLGGVPGGFWLLQIPINNSTHFV